MKVARVYNNYVRIPLLPGTQFTSVTYEALIYIDFFGNNNTVMGCEGTLIFRIGDAPLLEKDHLQIAGKSEYSVSQALGTGKWYHVAFTYNQSTGKTAIFINGEKLPKRFGIFRASISVRATSLSVRWPDSCGANVRSMVA